MSCLWKIFSTRWTKKKQSKIGDDDPNIGSIPLFAESVPIENIEMAFQLKRQDLKLEPVGSSLIWEQIESNLKSIESRKHSTQQNPEHIRRRIRAILEPCVEANERRSNSARPIPFLELRDTNYFKSRDILFEQELKPLLAWGEFAIRDSSYNMLNFVKEWKDEKALTEGIRRQNLMREYFIVAIAECRNLVISRESHVLSYMGIVHKTRKDNGRFNCAVYGLYTDGYVFRFWKIDNDSQVSSSPVYAIEAGHCKDIVTLIQNILQNADKDC